MVFIIVEGKTDKELIKNILSPMKENSNFKFLGLKGIDSVKKTIDNLEELGLSQNSYFAIVDADNSFKDINEEMEKLTKTNNVPFYIFPNHKDDGDLETLLLSGIEEENKIIKCFNDYQKCVGKKVDNKAKLYAYTTLELKKRPEEYIKELDTDNILIELKTKLKNLFKEQK